MHNGGRATLLLVNDVMTANSKVATRLPEELTSSALFLLKRLGMAAKERSFTAYEELGLHPYPHAILAVLDEGTRETQGSIADSLGYDRGQLVETRFAEYQKSITPTLDFLKQKGVPVHEVDADGTIEEEEALVHQALGK